MKGITEQERKELFINVCHDIMHSIDWMNGTDLSDIGNCIGMAISQHTCKDGKDLNIWSFEKDDFIVGFNHGYSLNDGTH